MTRMRLFVILAILSLAAPLSAEVVVRAGEHGAFTRLTFTLESGMTWNVDARGSEARLRVFLSDLETPPDTSTVFDRIDRSRIQSLSYDEKTGAIVVALNCRCQARAFLASRDLLAIDLRDGDTDTKPALPLFLPETDAADAAAPSEPLLPQPLPLVRDIEESLARRVAKEVNLGRLTADAIGRNDFPQPGRQAGAFQDSQVEGLNLGFGAPREVGSVLPEAVGRRFLARPPECLADPVFGLLIAGSRPLDRIGRLLAEAYGPKDRVDSEAARDLAWAYLALGLVPEARQAAAISGHDDTIFEEFARLIGGSSGPVPRIAAGISCPGRAFFWAFLALGKAHQGEIEEFWVLDSFSELHPALKSALWPRLADALAAVGEQEVLETLARLNPDLETLETGATRRAATGASRGEPAGADINRPRSPLDLLSAFSRDPGPQAASDTQAEENAVVAASLEVELRGTAHQEESWRAAMLAHVQAGQFREARNLLMRREDISEIILTEALDFFLQGLVDAPDDAVFLINMHALAEETLAAASDQRLLAATDRLLALGFVDQAEMLLARLDAGSDLVKLRQARVLLQKGRPEEAEIAVIGLSDDPALQIRAQAREMMGDHAFAQTAFERLQDNDSAARAAWLSGDWEYLKNGVNDEDPDLAPSSELADLILSPTGPEPADSIMLGAARRSLEDSTRARELLQKLLRDSP